MNRFMMEKIRAYCVMFML